MGGPGELCLTYVNFHKFLYYSTLESELIWEDLPKLEIIDDATEIGGKSNLCQLWGSGYTGIKIEDSFLILTLEHVLVDGTLVLKFVLYKYC